MRIETERFEVERVVGSGAMGTVFRARDRVTGEVVALKVMRSDGRGHAARFDREAEVLDHLRHPRIVRYVGHGTTVLGERFLAMEWLDGENLKARLARRGLGLGEALVMAIGVAEGLGAAHRAGVVHRDVKPSNVLLEGGSVERVKVVDFGIARWADTEALTSTGDVVGTPAYMSPEQASGARQVGPAADVFGLGCVLYECIAGRPPFLVARRPGAQAMLSPPTLATAPRLRLVRPAVPAVVSELVARLLAREVRARPADGDLAAGELREVARTAGDLEPPSPPAVADAGADTAARAVGSEASRSGFADLQREHASGDELSPASLRALAVLARHVAMPMAILRSQCLRLAKDPTRLADGDLAEVAPALAEAVASVGAPGVRATVLAELLGAP
jgi:serine/threonine protein kinase